jgi:nucleotide-binding universal stress UspA family protein
VVKSPLTQIKDRGAGLRLNNHSFVEESGRMTWKDLIVHVDPTQAGLARMRSGVRLAERYQAHLTGLFIRMPLLLAAELPIVTGIRLEGGVRHQEFEQAVEREEAAIRDCEREFREAVARVSIEGDWSLADGGSPSLIDAEARFADLIIVGQGAGKGAAAVQAGFPAELALACGRPVLVIPACYATDAIAERVLVAWNGTREAARAVHDAMPLLERAQFVALLAVAPPWGETDDGMRELAKLADHLKRHGVTAERYVARAPEHAAGEEILAQAGRASCDLVVMGAYGHSHMREMVLGGATRTLLQDAAVPLFLSH